MPQAVLTITRVARRLGLSPRTIRQYAEEGFIRLERTGGRCLLRLRDVEEIILIERLKNDLGVNLQGVGVILEMRHKMMDLQDRMAEMQAEFDQRLRQALEEQRRELERPLSRRGSRSVLIVESDD